jgi:hypothetical protein
VTGAPASRTSSSAEVRVDREARRPVGALWHAGLGDQCGEVHAGAERDDELGVVGNLELIGLAPEATVDVPFFTLSVGRSVASCSLSAGVPSAGAVSVGLTTGVGLAGDLLPPQAARAASGTEGSESGTDVVAQYSPGQAHTPRRRGGDTKLIFQVESTTDERIITGKLMPRSSRSVDARRSSIGPPVRSR